MKLDPGMHIGLHLVFFGKTGVTANVNSVTLCRALPYGRRAASLKKDGGTLKKGMDAYPTPTQDKHRDIRPAKRVFPITSGPVWPSPAL
jgi:hypothetical protein